MIHGDQLYMAVLFWYLVQRSLSTVQCTLLVEYRNTISVTFYNLQISPFAKRQKLEVMSFSQFHDLPQINLLKKMTYIFICKSLYLYSHDPRVYEPS